MSHSSLSLALLMVVTVPLGLAACTAGLAMKGMNGTASCPPHAAADAHTNFRVISQLTPGRSANELTGIVPERQINLIFDRNETVNAYLYRTGHPRCRGLPTEEEFTPVMVSPEGIILGIGQAAFENYSKQSQKTAEVTPQSEEQDTSLSGFMKSLPF